MVPTQILLVMLVAMAFSIFAERHRLQAPLVLVFVGLVVSFIPGVEPPQLAPETILSIVVPPLLYSAALDFSFFSFMRRIGSILNLSVLLVVVTTFVVALAARSLIPALTVPAAFILGAALAPPDAVSGVAVGRKLGLPRRVMTIMRGESLLNDAAALALFGVAATLITGRSEAEGGVALAFLYDAVGGAALGVALGAGVDAVRRRLDNPALVTTLALLVPFSAYAIADVLGTSGIVAVVFAGFTLSHRSSDLGFAGRIQERELWRVTDAVLEIFAFAYMGLQLRTLVVDARSDGFNVWHLAAAAAGLLCVVIAVRIGWIFLTASLARWRHRAVQARDAARAQQQAALPAAQQPDAARTQLPDKGQRLQKAHKLRKRRLAEPLSWRENLVLSWSGMRGVVTLAAAAATPLLTAQGRPVPGRSAVVLVAFAVAVATLLLQGTTLPWLVRALRLPPDDDTLLDQQRLRARQLMRASARTTLEQLRSAGVQPDALSAIEHVLARAEAAADAAANAAASATDNAATTDNNRDAGAAAPEDSVFADIARQIHAAQRTALIAERDALRLDDEVLRELLEGVDLEQATLAQKTRAAPA